MKRTLHKNSKDEHSGGHRASTSMLQPQQLPGLRMRTSAPVELEPPPEAERSRRLWSCLWSCLWSPTWSRTLVAELPPAVRNCLRDKRGFPLTSKVVVCSTCQLPQEDVMINQQRNNLARLQMLNALPHRLLPNLMDVQSL